VPEVSSGGRDHVRRHQPQELRQRALRVGVRYHLQISNHFKTATIMNVQ
jgi:hypothetical protein